MGFLSKCPHESVNSKHCRSTYHDSLPFVEKLAKTCSHLLDETVIAIGYITEMYNKTIAHFGNER